MAVNDKVVCVFFRHKNPPGKVQLKPRVVEIGYFMDWQIIDLWKESNPYDIIMY